MRKNEQKSQMSGSHDLFLHSKIYNKRFGLMIRSSMHWQILGRGVGIKIPPFPFANEKQISFAACVLKIQIIKCNQSRFIQIVVKYLKKNGIRSFTTCFSYIHPGVKTKREVKNNIKPK